MPISEYIKNLRTRIGHELVLMPSVAALIRNDAGEVLFQLRADGGQWGLPSGAIDPGETPAMAIVREVYEETGLVVEVMSVAGVFGGPQYTLTYENGDVVEYTCIVFECRAVGGELAALDGESRELMYLPAAHRPDMYPTWPDELFDPPGTHPPLFR